VIIVYPDNIVRFGNFSNYVGEGCVDSFVSLPEIFAVFRIEGKKKKKGPDSSVTEPVIVGFDIVLGERNRVSVFR